MKRRDAKDDFSSLNDKKRFIGAAEELGMRRSEFMVYLEKLVRKLEQVIEALCLLGYVKDENRVFNEVNALIATLLNSRYMIEHYDSKLISVIQEVLNCTREIFQDSDIDYEEQLQDNEEGNLDEHLCSNAKKWEEIYGLENIKEALIETFCYPIELPHLFKSSKALQKTCHSVLLYGPPGKCLYTFSCQKFFVGTGKSMIVYSLAEYLKRVYKLEMSFYQISSSDILSKWTGESEKNIKKVFKIAKSNSPSICKVLIEL
jgi:SpoVK/Ycf46/Vps4 family AAA+-type ATPase